MTLLDISLSCDKCKTQISKTVTARSPSEYSDPNKASVLSMFWCKKCSNPQAFRTFFKEEDNQLKVSKIARIDPSSLLTYANPYQPELPKEPIEGISNEDLDSDEGLMGDPDEEE